MQNRLAPKRLHRFRPASRTVSPGTPSTAPAPADFEPTTFYRTMTKLGFTAFRQNFLIPVRP
eukprot:15227987-Alexandrium_andersonii.AAC.1